MSLSESLKYARRIACLTRKQVSQRCGIDDSWLSDFEHGKNEPSLGQIAKLADVYNLDLIYFLSPDRCEAADFLKVILKYGPVWSKDIWIMAKYAGHNWNNIKSVKKELNILSEQIGFGKYPRCYWRYK